MSTSWYGLGSVTVDLATGETALSDNCGESYTWNIYNLRAI